MNILTICHGNAYRSPLAAAVLRSFDLKAQSAGFKPHGKKAPAKWAVLCAALGFPLAGHKPQPVTPDIMRWADRIFVMTPHHREKLERIITHEWHLTTCPPLVLLGDIIKVPLIADPAFDRRRWEEIARTIVNAATEHAKVLKGW